MKYGLVVNIKTENIGDDIQSFAAKQFLPDVDYVIGREALDTFDSQGEVVKAIMNGWYMYSKFNWPPTSAIDPLWVAMHISENDYFGIGERFLEGIGGAYLRHYGRVDKVIYILVWAKEKDAMRRQSVYFIILFRFMTAADKRQWSSAASIPRRKTRVKLCSRFCAANVPSHQICRSFSASRYSGLQRRSRLRRLSTAK